MLFDFVLKKMLIYLKQNSLEITFLKLLNTILYGLCWSDSRRYIQFITSSLFTNYNN